MPPLVVDHTLLRALTSCDLQAWVRHAQGLASREEKATLKAGSAWHTAQAVYWNTSDPVQAFQAFQREYQAFAEASVPHHDAKGRVERLSWPNLSKIVGHWFRTHPLNQFPYQLYSHNGRPLIEIPFELPLDEHGDILFVGRMDLVVALEGLVMPKEAKSTGRITDYWIDKFYLDGQGTGYCYALEQLLGVRCGGFLVEATEFCALPSDDTKKCKTHGVKYEECGVMHSQSRLLGPYPRDRVHIETWRSNVLYLAQRYADLVRNLPRLEDIELVPQQGLFNGSCPFCFMKDLCTAGRAASLVKANLEYDPWDARDHAGVVLR